MSVQEYEDILSVRRQEASNWLWITRALKTTAAVNISPRPLAKSHKESVLRNSKIKELIEAISRRDGIDPREVEQQLQQILDEIGYNKNLKVIRFLGFTLVKICLNVLNGIYVNYEGILEVKSKMGRCPVVFVPSHRSYADFIIFSYVCFHYDIEIPAIAAGMDFHGMMGMGEMLRNTGAFFMRRSYNDDSMYWTTFKEYVNQIVSNGDLPIEFFIEGTRSRSNKCISPKYGLFNMILKAFFLAQVPDILFVPVSISYDRILEENLFAFELLGIPKPKESTSGFFKSLKIVKEKFGNIYFHVGRPISARDFFGDELDRSAHSFAPLHLHEITEEEKRIIPPLGYEIIRQQQLTSPINYFNLLALILNKNLSRGQKGMLIEDLTTEMKIVKKKLQSWNAKFFEQDVDEALKESLVVHSNLITCRENNSISLVANRVTVGKLDPTKLKAYALSEDTISYSVPFVMLQIYVNPVLHYFVDPAIIVIILRSSGKMRNDELFKHFCTLRSIFSYEFVLSENWYKMQFEEALDRLISDNILLLRNDEYDNSKNSYFEEVLLSSIQTFFLIYYVVTIVLQGVPEYTEEKLILANVQKLFEDVISKKNTFIHPYCMSLDSLMNCLNSFNKMGVVKKKRIDGKSMYQLFQEKLLKVKEDLEFVIPSFEGLHTFETFLHMKSKI